MDGYATTQRLTLAEIKAGFPSEWILIEDTETNESNELVGGRVLYHSPDRDEMYGQLWDLRPRRFATYFTGPPTEHVVLHWGGALTCWPTKKELVH